MNEKPMPEKKGEDIDISDFFRLIGNGINKIGLFFKNLFLFVYDFLITLFLFLKKKIVWLIIGIVVGGTFGAYRYFNNGPAFTSTMTVRSNFDNNYFLYNQLDYFNSLIHNGRINELSKEFNLTEAEASRINNFSIKPLKNEFEAAKLYRDEFLDFKRNRFTQDTIWSKTIRFRDFEKDLTDIDYPLQYITVYSTDPDIYSRIQDGIYKSVNNNPGLIKRKNLELRIREQEEEMLERSLIDLDTLRQIYNKTLTREPASTGNATTQLILGERAQRYPELDLYDKTLLIKDELVTLQQKSADRTELLQVYSGFNKVGARQSTLRQLAKWILIGLLVSFIILAIIEFFKFLSRVEKSRFHNPAGTTTPGTRQT